MDSKNKQHNLTINLYHADIFNDYGVNEYIYLQDDLISTIETMSNTVKLNTQLNLNIGVDKNVEVNETQFTEAFKNTFTSSIKMKRLELIRCLTTGIVLFMIGVILVLLNVFIFDGLNKFIYELFGVISWVFVWAGTEALTIELIQIIIEIKKATKLLKTKITFTKK